MAFGQDFLKILFGNDYLKDYTHASKTFRTNGYENTPRFKFLFHVYFNLNNELPQVRNSMLYTVGEKATIGLLVKRIDLPRYTIDVDVMNQYNRKRLVQKKINYQPCRVTFHDDGGDLIRNLWYNYYAYYFKDPSQPYRGQTSSNSEMGVNASRTAGFGYNVRDTYENDRFVNDWGYIGESYSDGTNSARGKPQFFRDISIYGFNQHKFVEYVLINPMISEWSHDTYDYSQGNGIMENQVTIQYETVKYYSGAIGAVRSDTNVQGFADPNYYDQVRSPIGRPGGTRSVLGQGGLLDTGIGIYQDLQTGTVASLIGAAQKAGTAYQTYKGANLKATVREETNQAVKDTLRGTLPGVVRSQPGVQSVLNTKVVGPVFPTPPKQV